MRRIVLTFGLIAGAVMSAMMVITTTVLDDIGFDKGAIVGYTSMVLAFLMTYVGIKSYRDNVGGGVISFGRALSVGLLITMVATVCYVVTWEVIYYKVAPDFGEKYAAYAVESTRKAGGSAAEIAKKLKEMQEFQEMYKNPIVNIGFTFLEPLPVGVALALLSAALLKRKTRMA